MVLINGQKFACEACIRGHRASGCAHMGRRMVPVRPKGRPSSQCEQCRAKRAAGRFHGRCECNSLGSDDEGSVGSSQAPSIAVEKRKRLRKNSRTGHQLDAEQPQETDDDLNDISVALNVTPSQKFSLELLMNPCRCRTTGICTCCKSSSDDSQKYSLNPDEQVKRGECDCSDGGEDCCCRGSAEKEGCCSLKADAEPGNVCKDGGEAKTAEACLELSQSDEDSRKGGLKQKGLCKCGPWPSSDRQQDKCQTCSPCAFGLHRPSGIDVVEEWMSQDADRSRDLDIESTSTPSFQQQPRPPFESARAFFDSHFRDESRRAWFAAQLNGHEMPPSADGTAAMAMQSAAFGERLAGESDETWQARHGFSYLTPEAIAIFDQSRAFKKRRAEFEARASQGTATEDDGAHKNTQRDDDAIENAQSESADSIALLRARALSAKNSRPSSDDQASRTRSVQGTRQGASLAT